MIELELPNLKADETKISPPRVKVLSKEIDPVQYNEADEHSRTEEESRRDLKPVLDANSIEQSDVGSEVEIHHRLPATMRNSNNFRNGKVQKQKDVSADGKVTDAQTV